MTVIKMATVIVSVAGPQGGSEAWNAFVDRISYPYADPTFSSRETQFVWRLTAYERLGGVSCSPPI